MYNIFLALSQQEISEKETYNETYFSSNSIDHVIAMAVHASIGS